VGKNTITLGEDNDLYSQRVTVIKPVFWREIKAGEEFKAKFRYMSSFSPVVITEVSEHYIIADLPERVKSLTPGQVAVFYDHDIIAAAGIIQPNRGRRI